MFDMMNGDMCEMACCVAVCFAIIGLALDSTAMGCMFFEGDKKCTENDRANLKVSGSAFLLAAGAIVAMCLLYMGYDKVGKKGSRSFGRLF